MARDLHYSPGLAATAIVVVSPLREKHMAVSEELQRWAGRICLVVVVALGMLAYHYANVRFVPLMAGFAILAGVCYAPRVASQRVPSLRPSGQHPAI